MNEYGQPINDNNTLENFDSAAKIDSVRNELVEIFELGSAYGRVIGYNARRLVLRDSVTGEMDSGSHLDLALAAATAIGLVVTGYYTKRRGGDIFLYIFLDICTNNCQRSPA